MNTQMPLFKSPLSQPARCPSDNHYVMMHVTWLRVALFTLKFYGPITPAINTRIKRAPPLCML
jgi:hypothetical protein